jgi:hypothetical protein
LPAPAIDHAVVAVRDLAIAARAFAELGFTLTPLGRHSIGSRNHCIMLGSTYIELLEPAGEHPWLAYYRDFVARGEGLAAIALATSDADASYRDLLAHGVAAQPPMDLARPVDLRGEPRTARFRLVQISPDKFLCQHLTRELLWRPEWQRHANGASELVEADLPGAALRLEGFRSTVRVHGVELRPG